MCNCLLNIVEFWLWNHCFWLLHFREYTAMFFLRKIRDTSFSWLFATWLTTFPPAMLQIVLGSHQGQVHLSQCIGAVTKRNQRKETKNKPCQLTDLLPPLLVASFKRDFKSSVWNDPQPDSCRSVLTAKSWSASVQLFLLLHQCVRNVIFLVPLEKLRAE